MLKVWTSGTSSTCASTPPQNPHNPRVRGGDWAALNPDGTFDGHIYFHLGDDSAFRAERFNGMLR
jgi:hypothetical protein